MPPGPAGGARRELYSPAMGQYIPGYLNPDGTVDRFNPRTGTTLYGISNQRGGQDLFNPRTGKFYFGFRNPDGSIDYLTSGGRWIWSTGP